MREIVSSDRSHHGDDETKNQIKKMSATEKKELHKLLNKQEELCNVLRNRNLSKEEEMLMIEIEEKLEALA